MWKKNSNKLRTTGNVSESKLGYDLLDKLEFESKSVTFPSSLVGSIHPSTQCQYGLPSEPIRKCTLKISEQTTLPAPQRESSKGKAKMAASRHNVSELLNDIAMENAFTKRPALKTPAIAYIS